MLRVHYGADGHIVDAEPIDGGEPKAGSDIVRTAVAAVKQWTVKPEMIAGHGLAGEAKIPLCFSLPQKEYTCRFTDPDSKRVLDGDHAILAVNSVVRLETDVAGQVL